MIKWLRENHQTIVRVLGSILAIILLIILLREEGGNEVLSALRRVSVWYFLAALAMLFISRIFMVMRWHVLLKSAGLEISFFHSSMLTFSGLFSSNFLPTTIGGDVVRLGGAMQMGYDRAICLASLIADRLVGLAGMVFTLPFGLFPVLSLGSNSLQSITVITIYQKGIDFIKRTFNVFDIWLKKPLALLSSLFATFGNMIFIFLAMYILIIGIDRFISYWLVAGLWSLTYFITLIPISINGFGVQELSLTFLFSEFGGLSHSESLTIAILIRALFIITSIPGAFSLPSILVVMNEK